ncbi:MAG: alpha-L-fucosidase, partial [Lachnospiraceae bacterium]|nr:alpha-L-fucosidase [Lachnospiraceae bacterium]
PKDGNFLIRSLGRSADPNKPNFHVIIRDVEFLGFPEKPQFAIDDAGLHLTARSVKSDFPVVCKIFVE